MKTLAILAALTLTGCLSVDVGRIGADTIDDIQAAERVTTAVLRESRQVWGFEMSWASWGFGAGLWPVAGDIATEPQPEPGPEPAGRQPWEVIREK